MTTHQMTRRQQLDLRLTLLEQIAAEIRVNLEQRKAIAGPQQPGDVETNARWLGKSLHGQLHPD